MGFFASSGYVLLMLFLFGGFAMLLAARLRLESERKGIDHDAILVRKSPKKGGYLALYNDFMVYRANALASVNRIPYSAVTRLGVDEFRFPQIQAAIALEYRDEQGANHLAHFMCPEPDGFVPALREKISRATTQG